MKTSKKSFLGIVLIALNFNILAQVGIGTSNPHASAALEIQSTSKGFLFPRMTKLERDAISNIATGLTIYCTDCSTSGGGVLQVYNASNWEDLNDFVSASTGGMFNEKVGIGTIGTTPSYALDVDAKDKGSSTYSARFTNSAPDNNIYNLVRFTQGQPGTAEGYLGTGGSNVLNAAFRNNFVVGTKNNTPLVLNTNDTIRMRIDTIGRVGIGTNNPEYPFHLDAADRSKDEIYAAKFENSKTDNDLYNLVLFTQGQSDTALGYLGTGGSNVLNVAFRNNFVVGTKNNTPLVLNTNDTEKMRIDTIGRVGIGTTPLFALDIDANDKGSSTYSARFTNSAIGDNISNVLLFTQGEENDESNNTAIGYLGTGGSGVLNPAFVNNFVVGTKNSTPLVLNTHDIERMRIDANGNVGIGTDDCDDYKLKVNGVIRATNGTAESWTSTSDRRWKKDIKTLDNSLDKIATLRGVSYLWRVDDFPNKNFSDGTQLGVIAQEIETVFPELVHTDKKGYKSVQYSNIVAPLIEAIKTLKHQNEAQQDQITSLIERVKALEDK
jgi:hypothetical protein